MRLAELTGHLVVQKGLSGLRPPSPAPRHVLSDRRLRDLNPELQQFAMDPRCDGVLFASPKIE